MEFVWNAHIDKLLHGDTLTGIAVTDKTTSQSYTISCDGLFVAIGRTPDTQMVAGQLTLDEQGYILADETTQTSLAGVFAVGDIRTKPLRQIVTAAADGATASKYVEDYVRAYGR